MKNIRLRFENIVDKVSPTRFFVITAFVFGFIFIVITPPFQAPDEIVHFYRAYQISELNFVIDNGTNMAGGYLPKSLSDTVVLTTTKPAVKAEPGVKYSVRKTLDSFAIKQNSDNRYFFNFPAAAAYPPTSYIPQATGVGVARVLGAPPIAMLYIGRICNMLVWIAVCSLAINLIPRKKWAMAFVGLLPMSLFQAGSLTTDVMAVGSMLLFFVFILKLIESKITLTNRQIALLISIASLMVLTKQVMFLFLPLILLIPNKLFGQKNKAYLAKTLVIIVPLMMLALWVYASHGVKIPYAYENGQVPTKQISFIVHNPHSYVNVLWNTTFFTWGDVTFRSFIGIFGAVDTPLSELFVAIGYSSLLLVMLLNTQGQKFRTWLDSQQKLLIGGIAFLYWLAVNTALYVYFTPVGFKIILGMQGRYFLPLAILAVPLLYGSWLMASKRAYRRIAIGMPLILLMASVVTIYFRYYIHNV